MKVLVTGGLGNLGLWVVESLLSEGVEVDVLGRTEKVHIEHGKYAFLQADISIYTSIIEVISCHYDACIHLASYNEHFQDGYEEKALSVNAQGTENICRALQVHGVDKFIYLSTFHVYGSSHGIISETTDIKPSNVYGLTHYFAEKYVELYSRKYQFNFCIFRLTNSYGCPKNIETDKWYLVVNDLCKQAYETKKIILSSNGKAQRDFIWMGDVAGVISESLTNDALNNACYNLSAKHMLSVNNIAQIIRKAFYYKYHLNIIISCNEKDDSIGSSLTVENKKLLSVLDWTFSDRLFDEALNIFSLLECKS